MKYYKPKYSTSDVAGFIKDSDNFLILGSGYEAERIIKGLKQCGKNVEGMLTLSKNSGNTSIQGIPVYHVDNVSLNGRKILIASLNNYDSEDWEIKAAKYLINEKHLSPFKDFVPLMGFFINMEHFERYNGLLGKNFYDFMIKNEKIIRETKGILDDDHSLEMLDKVISYKLMAYEHDAIDIEELPCPPSRLLQFSNNRVTLPVNIGSKELMQKAEVHLKVGTYSYKSINSLNKKVIIDGGAFDGDTAAYFIQCSPNAEIHSFEPGEPLFRKLKELAAEAHNIVPVQSGLWDKKDTLRFNLLKRGDNIGMGSFIGEGESSIDVITLDEYVHEQGLKSVDFIKMDIEGSEMEALSGAHSTITQFKPQMAICIYHKPDHLFSIPLWIKHNFKEYSVYIDHRHIHPAETVCYAGIGGAHD